MATGVLPMYYHTRSENIIKSAICTQFFKRLKVREKSVVLVILGLFFSISFFGMFFLPDFRDLTGIQELDIKAPANMFIPPHINDHNKEGRDVHEIDDKNRLKEKIGQIYPPIPKPGAPDFPEPRISRDGTPSLSTKTSVDVVDSEGLTKQRQEKVVEMMRHAWKMYELHAWGHNELRPISKVGHSANIFGQSQMGATIVDGLDTLYLMGLMDDFKKGRDWVEEHFHFEANSDVSIFEINIRFVGGLLSCYALTGDEIFKTKATEVANKLLPAFETETGIPMAILNLQTGHKKNWAWASSGCSILSEFGTLHLEFAYLSNITGNPIYLEKVNKIRQFVSSLSRPDDVYPNYLHPSTGRWGQRHTSVGALGDSFYEYLLKAWLQNRNDVLAKQMYDEAIQVIEGRLFQRSRSGLLYIAEMKNSRLEHKMDHLACFTSGMIALGAKHSSNETKYLKFAEDIGFTCHESYDRTETKLGPESFRFDGSLEAKTSRPGEMYYILRPEVVEAYFYLWRLTKNVKYREWAWEAVEALERHCRTEGGYTGIKDVYNKNSQRDDVQQSFFLAETLKYLYLIFSPDSTLDLDHWVLNTEAHPLPVLVGGHEVATRGNATHPSQAH